jgi:hypothetical protein
MAFFQQQDNIYKRETNINDEDLTSVFYTLSGQEDEIIDDKPIKSTESQEKTNGFLDRICRSNDKFKTVNEKAFNWYVQFLSSKNLSWFHNAEREIE